MKTATGNQPSSEASARRGGAVASLLRIGAGSFAALLALPVCMLFGLPLAGWAIGFGLVVFNRIVQLVVERSVRDSGLTVALGALGFSMIFRALFTALVLFFIGASVGASGDNPVGMDRPDLARVALIVFIIGFTIDAGIEAIRRAAQREELVAADAAAAREVSTPQETPA